MRRLLPLSVAVLMCMASACGPAAGPAARDNSSNDNSADAPEASPVRVAKAFMEHLGDADLSKLKALCKAKTAAQFDSAPAVRDQPANVTFSTQVGRATVDGIHASVEMLCMATSALTELQNDSRTLSLVQEADGSWLVDVGDDLIQHMREHEDQWRLRAADASNLLWLARYAMGAVRENKQLPAARGKAFWVALCIGDGRGSVRVIDAAEAAKLLRSPADADVMSKADLKARLDACIAAGTGTAGLNATELSTMCSYLGPADPAALSKPEMIIGATGPRAASAMLEGINTVNTARAMMYLAWSTLESRHSWTPEDRSTLVGKAPLNQLAE
ncbi:MAG: hypothetical protein AB7K09_24545 [Planctomycetota bacterium]